MSQDNNIKVIARFRPPNSLEKKSGGTSVIEIEDETTVGIKCDEHTGSFTFDRVFGSDTSQDMIYNYAIRDTLEGNKDNNVFNGYNGTVFCYGQTGSGKTFTMMGADIDNEDLKGIIPRIVEGVFAKIDDSPHTTEYLVKASYMEIYMERIRDLLNPTEASLPVHEDKVNGVYVKGLVEIFVNKVEEVYEVMRLGAKNRVVAYTNMNAESSRSHSIFQITVEQKDTISGKTKIGRMFLVDLAGSEKVGKTGATGQTLEEAKKINKSLSALGMVINALTDGKSTHIPYRDSKLTRILQESLGGNSRTTLIINCSPSSFNAAETVGTLRFGMRAKSIKNKAKVNQELSPAELKIMLKKSQGLTMSFRTYCTALEGEVSIWRKGGSVDVENQATWEKVLGKEKAAAAAAAAQQQHQQQQQQQPPSTPTGKSSSVARGSGYSTPRSAGTGSRLSVSAGAGFSAPPLSPTTNGARLGAMTPTLSFQDTLISELGSRSGSPTTVMSEDEREEFLRRENELNDLLADKEHDLQDAVKAYAAAREELEFLKSESGSTSRHNEELATEAAQLKLELEKVNFGHKEAELTIESLTEANTEMTEQLEKLREELDELRREATDGVEIDKEKERAARVATMMKELDSTKAVSQHEAGMGNLLRSLVEAGDDDKARVEILNNLRRELDERNDIIREKDISISELQRENAILKHSSSEAEARYDRLLADYEEALEQSIVDEEQHQSTHDTENNKMRQRLEEKYNERLGSQKIELDNALADLNSRLEEVARNTVTIRELRSENRELQSKIDALTEKARTDAMSASAEGTAAPIIGDSSVEAATTHAMNKEREMHALRRDMAQRIFEYDTMRKSLMRDVQNRCEKIIELEMALDDSRSQVSVLSRRVNNPNQSQRMQLLEKNIAQLTNIQRELVEQNTDLKKRASLSDRKLQARTERIEYLEARLQDLSNQAEAWKRKAEELQTLRSHESARTNVQPTSGNVLRFSRIAKPLRGGGGNTQAAPASVEEKTGRSTGFFSWGASN
ncbi:hypothetical protein GGI15_002900 [Coemansia interrupta]|uniref:Kinesin motor domain-containing protein n=1 Tax=Coemansia interrupta TaxID=1126814 RepID=A0A9W8LK68_9FUNG|nr:hypothetical protein GGI15_002900 [Coemansia interrupta]